MHPRPHRCRPQPPPRLHPRRPRRPPSLQTALRRCRHGDTVLLLPGRYPSVVLSDLDATVALPLHIRGVAERLVMIGGTRDAPAVRVRRCRAVALSCMRLRDAQCGVEVDAESIHIRISNIAVLDCSRCLSLPSKHLHCIEVTDVRFHCGDSTAKRAWDWLTDDRPLTVWPWVAQVPLGVAVVCYIAGCSLVVLMFAARFHEDGGLGKVQDFVVKVWTSLLIDAFLKQPALRLVQWVWTALPFSFCGPVLLRFTKAGDIFLHG